MPEEEEFLKGLVPAMTSIISIYNPLARISHMAPLSQKKP
jgi:hypothetical protein